MTSSSAVYIAGVGSSALARVDSPSRRDVATLISAATKALLDAGVTYDDVAEAVAGLKGKDPNIVSSTFKAFDSAANVTVDTVDDGQELGNAVHRVQNHGAHCVLVLTLKKSTAIALLLVSEDFLWRHPYLKDSAVLVHESDSTQASPESRSQTDLADLCRTVWELRGWSKTSNAAGRHEFALREPGSNHTFTLSRADGKDIPPFEDVEHRHDGKSRLGYNPTIETREISQEDFEAVRAEANERRAVQDRPSFNRKGGDRAALAKL